MLETLFSSSFAKRFSLPSTGCGGLKLWRPFWIMSWMLSLAVPAKRWSGLTHRLLSHLWQQYKPLGILPLNNSYANRWAGTLLLESGRNSPYPDFLMWSSHSQQLPNGPSPGVLSTFDQNLSATSELKVKWFGLRHFKLPQVCWTRLSSGIAPKVSSYAALVMYPDKPLLRGFHCGIAPSGHCPLKFQQLETSAISTMLQKFAAWSSWRMIWSGLQQSKLSQVFLICLLLGIEPYFNSKVNLAGLIVLDLAILNSGIPVPFFLRPSQIQQAFLA